jgi:adenylylsulfate kinase-like enzyme/SAM-dependent methyltransferase
MKQPNPINGVIWITGFSSSGKTTLSRKVEALLKKQKISTVLLDGDDLRNIFGDQWGYDRESRVNLARIYMRLCSHLSAQGHVVIISAIAMFDEVGDWVRANIQNSMQVYLDVPRSERESRDLQTKNISGSSNFNDTMYDIPTAPELTIKNFGGMATEEAASIIFMRFFDMAGTSKDRGRKEHWDSYYQKSIAPLQPSSFARAVLPSLKAGKNLLEIGSGNGRDAAFFASNGVNVFAIDRSEAAIRICKEQHSDLLAKFFAGTLAEVRDQFGTKKFDAVFTRFVLHAMPLSEEIETLAICSQLMKAGAKLLIECRSINDPLARKGEIISQTERIDGHYRRFIILDELKDRLSLAGFKVLSAIESDGLAAFGNDNPVVIRVTAEKMLGFVHLVNTSVVEANAVILP